MRSDGRLHGPHAVSPVLEEIRDYYWRYLVTRDLLELRNITTVAELIVSCAASRRESAGFIHDRLP